ncbi:hypothetical protein RRG08_041992 [Elysia crispata]|uniref:Uncharacterized protein n=1 Tax=Elysia crispata TaxID=231223 RepID=A0AAE0Z139_9GAST|nr:hypothetical protein RRG08_041992 [Elysia crispata]
MFEPDVVCSTLADSYSVYKITLRAPQCNRSVPSDPTSKPSRIVPFKRSSSRLILGWPDRRVTGVKEETCTLSGTARRDSSPAHAPAHILPPPTGAQDYDEMFHFSRGDLHEKQFSKFNYI